jgi:hypothetical protein
MRRGWAGEDERNKQHIAGLKSRPKFSVVVTVHEMRFHMLNQAAVYMRRPWVDLLDRGPFWSPNLALRSTEPHIAYPLSVARPSW